MRDDIPESPEGTGEADGWEAPKRPLRKAAILMVTVENPGEVWSFRVTDGIARKVGGAHWLDWD